MFKRLTFALLPAILLFGVAEIVLRALGWPEVTTAFEHNEPFWIVDPDLHSYKMPHNEENTSFQVSTNSDGLRTSIEVTDPKKELRIMTLGCSTTFGWGVSDVETYPARLQTLLTEAGYSSVEVVNGGQPGYTSFQGAWLWDAILEDYKPDVVLIGYIVQDARKAAYSDKSQAILQGDNRFLKDNMLYRSKGYLALRYGMGKVQVQAKERSSQDDGGVYRVPPADYVVNLRSLTQKIQNTGAKAVLFGYPLERTGYTEQHRLILKVAAQELQVGHLDPQVDMEQAATDTRLYFPRDKGHANAAGNDQIAQWIFEHLKSNQYLPTPNRETVMKRDATLVLLVLNEIDGLRQVWSELPLADFERVVAVDGGSTDGSRDFLTEKNIPILEQSIAGRGVAFRVAAEAVDTERLVFYSPDGNEDPADIVRLDDALIAGANLAIASRFATGSINEETDLVRARARVNKALTWIANKTFGQGDYITDTINGFRALRRQDLLDLNTTVKRFPIEYQISIRAMQRGWKISEIATIEGQRAGGESKAISWPVGKDHLKVLLTELPYAKWFSHR